jgi:hypothetical protein
MENYAVLNNKKEIHLLYIKNKKAFTQIGSLPHRDVEEAVAYSLKNDIPFLPELTALGDFMLEYIKNPGKLNCLDKFKEHEFDTVKVQTIGPVTLMMSGYGEDDALSRIYDHISTILDGLKAKEIILFLDEPSLGYSGLDYRRLWKPLIESFSVIWGVHTCGNMQWDQLFETDIDIISFDASKYDITKYYKTRKKRIAWGIQSFEDIKDWKRGDLITPPCGMPHTAFTIEDCERKLKQLLQISSKFKA